MIYLFFFDNVFKKSQLFLLYFKEMVQVIKRNTKLFKPGLTFKHQEYSFGKIKELMAILNWSLITG